jgi:spore coat protein U-like protein
MRKSGELKNVMKGTIWSAIRGLALTGGVLMAANGLAEAQTTRTASFQVTANVAANCTITAQPLAFGSYDPLQVHAATALDAQSDVTITCTRGSASTVGLGLGANAAGAVRRMINGTQFLTYELYKEAARTNIWGDAGAGLVNPGAAPSIAPRALTVYGRIPAGQDVGTGPYTDTVIASVTF